MIALHNVHVVFHPATPQQRTALAGIDLTVEAGDFITIIGGNGAGKSTLMGVLAGELLPSSGRIVIDGQDCTRIGTVGRAANVARVFQDPAAGTCAELTVAENLALAYLRGRRRHGGLACRRTRLQQFRTRVAELGLGLEDRLDTPIGLLSGGQRQALSLLMATLQHSAVLLLDEHTAALDPGMTQAVLSLTEQLIAKHRLTTIMVTHALDSALRLGQRTIMLEQGRIVLDVAGAARQKLRPADLLQQFAQAPAEPSRR